MEIKELWRCRLIQRFILAKSSFIFALFFVILLKLDLPEASWQLFCSFGEILDKISIETLETDSTVTTYTYCHLMSCLKSILVDIMQSIHPRLYPMFHQKVKFKEETTVSLQTREDVVRMSREATELWKSKTQDLHWLFLRTHGRLIAGELFLRYVPLWIFRSYVHSV